MNALLQALVHHQAELTQCRLCPNMIPPVITGEPVLSPLLLVGQAPGGREGELGRPFAWTAGKTLFGWFSSIGLDEAQFRAGVYMAAVCRCFPGKQAKGGDRVPDKTEIANCRGWLEAELHHLRPQLIVPVGKLAIAQFVSANKLAEVVGLQHRINIAGRELDLIPLPHPSGASTWHRSEPGKALLAKALALISAHPAWQQVVRDASHN